MILIIQAIISHQKVYMKLKKATRYTLALKFSRLSKIAKCGKEIVYYVIRSCVYVSGAVCKFYNRRNHKSVKVGNQRKVSLY